MDLIVYTYKAWLRFFGFCFTEHFDGHIQEYRDLNKLPTIYKLYDLPSRRSSSVMDISYLSTSACQPKYGDFRLT